MNKGGQHTEKRLFYLSGGGYLISSLAVLLMPFGDISGQNGSKLLAITSAALFWIALIIAATAQIRLRIMQKPYREGDSPLVNIISSPTVWTASAFVISLIAAIVLSTVNMNGFILYLCIFVLLLSAEWTILSHGKFSIKKGKAVLKTYRN